MIFVLLMLLMAAVVAFFVLPTRDDITALKVQKETSAGELSVLDSEYNELTNLSNEVAKSEAAKVALLDALPVGTAQDSMILELTDLAEASGFALNAISFTEGSDEAFGKTLTANVNVSGEYKKVISLLSGIESAKRLMRVKSIGIQRTSETGISANLSIEAYYQ